MSKPLPRLVLASNNPGKIQEFRDLLRGDVEIVSLADLGLASPPETATTFAGNAEIKARYLHERTGEVTLADDSGLEIDALEGRPGVLSARYAGEHGDDTANRRLVMEQLAGVSPGLRSARFVAAIALVDAAGRTHLVQGTCDGEIALQERGSNGFGYDSLFLLSNGRTMAELEPAEKGQLSHRAMALRSILPHLAQALGLDSLVK